MEPFKIGKAMRLRCFEGLKGAELGLEYESGTNAWMNSDVLFHWLQRFDTMIGQTQGQRDVLFVDNASSHGISTNTPLLQHAHLEFLPKNTTPLLQLLDQEMMASIKKRYKSMIAKRAVNLIDDGYIDNPY